MTARPPAPVAVIGAGLAGSAVAAALASGGVAADLYSDPNTEPASAVPLAILHPHLAGQRDPLERLRTLGLRVTRSWLAALEVRGFDSGRRSDGLLVQVCDERDRRRLARLPANGPGPRPLDPEQAHAALGVHLPSAAIYHPGGACVDPLAFTRSLLAAAGGAGRRIAQRIVAVRRLATGGGYMLETADGALERCYTDVVIAAGPYSPALVPQLEGGIMPVRGQATAVAATASSAGQRIALSGRGYITPAIEGQHWVGATLQRGRTDLAPQDADDAANRAHFDALWGQEPEVVDHFVAIRGTTRDRLPLAGPVAPGLWISAGHGSHALCTAPVCARIVAAGIRGRVHPLIRMVACDRRAMHARRPEKNRALPGLFRGRF